MDPFYRQVMLGETKSADVASAKPFVEDLLQIAAPYLDTNLEEKLTLQFQQCFWEMYLVAMFLDVQIDLIPRAERSRPDYGPDIQLRSGEWVEAVVATAGVGPDAVSEGQPGRARTVPDEQMKLRVLNALAEKHRKFERYLADGLVKPDQPCVVAINTCLVPAAILERTVPRVARAVLGLGNEVAIMDRQTGAIIEWTHEHQPVVKKRSGADVSQVAFLDGSQPLISACLHSSVHAAARPDKLGGDFVLVHNPTANVALRRNAFRRGAELWVENDKLNTHRHDTA